MRLLTFTNLYPNAVTPHHGVFVENRIRHLVATGEAETRVIAPVPWFPLRSERFGRYARLAAVPRHDERHGIAIDYPRYVTIPRVGMTAQPFLMYLAARVAVRRSIERHGEFDLIDAHYFYPDGVAAALLAQEFRKPLVITARGTDLNLIPRYALPRRQIRWAARRADGLITVAAALRQPLVDLGIDASRVRVLRNGTDLDMFRPVDRDAVRSTLGARRTTILSVGHLIPRKGHDFAIRAIAELPDVDLWIVGSGPEEDSLRELATSLGVEDRVRLFGNRPHEELRDLYNAADVSVLASSREGWANVLLESMACGTPVVATEVWGTPEVVTSPESGVLVRREPDAIAAGIRAVLDAGVDRAATRAYAERFDWGETTRGQLSLFRSILERPGAASGD